MNQNNFEPNGGEIHGTIRKATPCINKLKKILDYTALNKWQLFGRWGLSIWQLLWQWEGLSEGAWGFKDLREITKKHHWDVLLVLRINRLVHPYISRLGTSPLVGETTQLTK